MARRVQGWTATLLKVIGMITRVPFDLLEP